MYSLVFFNAQNVKVHEDADVFNNALYLTLGVLPDGTRDILSPSVGQTREAKFRLQVLSDLKTRGVNTDPIRMNGGRKAYWKPFQRCYWRRNCRPD